LQATLKSKINFEGVGLHSGKVSKLVLVPAPADHGIWFKRIDIPGPENTVEAIYHNVKEKPLCTQLENNCGVKVSTVEHLMAALAGCGIQNILIELTSEEVPILDGCSEAFVEAILSAGIKRQNAKQYAVQIMSRIEVNYEEAFASLSPAQSLEIDCSIDFEEEAIGQQAKSLNMANGTFVRELSSSRTFCRKVDIDVMHSRGLALGGSYDNAIVFDKGNVLTPGGLRYRDEAVRHKMLDALGDLTLAGMPIIGRYVGIRSGHMVTHRLLKKLFSNPRCFRILECSSDQLNTLPGYGVTQFDMGSEYSFV